MRGGDYQERPSCRRPRPEELTVERDPAVRSDTDHEGNSEGSKAHKRGRSASGRWTSCLNNLVGRGDDVRLTVPIEIQRLIGKMSDLKRLMSEPHRPDQFRKGSL
jgi:hypothetical protein